MSLTFNLARADGKQYICGNPECKKETSTLAQGMCPSCWEIAQAAWHKKMAIRQDPNQFDMGRLVNLLLTQHWKHECTIIPKYMPPHPGKDTRPRCVVQFIDAHGEDTYLRYSNGPLQGYFWDIYGDDMHDPELALIALSQAPAPTNVGRVIPTHGN